MEGASASALTQLTGRIPRTGYAALLSVSVYAAYAVCGDGRGGVRVGRGLLPRPVQVERSGTLGALRAGAGVVRAEEDAGRAGRDVDVLLDLHAAERVLDRVRAGLAALAVADDRLRHRLGVARLARLEALRDE